MKILAIDPGTTQSAYTVISADTFAPCAFAKEDNDVVCQRMIDFCRTSESTPIVIIERLTSMGQRVGGEVFQTCEYVGYLTAYAQQNSASVYYITRKQEKKNLCNTLRCGDKEIRRALIERFARFDKKNGKGTKKHPDWFYGFHADVWAAYAVGVTWLDLTNSAA